MSLFTDIFKSWPFSIELPRFIMSPAMLVQYDKERGNPNRFWRHLYWPSDSSILLGVWVHSLQNLRQIFINIWVCSFFSIITLLLPNSYCRLKIVVKQKAHRRILQKIVNRINLHILEVYIVKANVMKKCPHCESKHSVVEVPTLW